ncbi:Uncharacterized protein PBTT_09006 [Plasmodiophora brassicae]|uniref:Uncharacterized protein n=1 Tax=Plasmodiophora brassicae TaxID=37360 RepID=A0A0G4J1Q6_PLABS|nr:hypothetical protein PBRA_008518 [Plasmodiophora brassicae]SPR00878.1 unnamed protein product [Plasmodiophora brassicae]
MQSFPNMGMGFQGSSSIPRFRGKRHLNRGMNAKLQLDHLRCEVPTVSHTGQQPVGSRCTNTSLKYQMVLLERTHGGVARSRGSGIRPCHNYRYLGCNAFIKFAAKRDMGREDFVLRCVEQYTGIRTNAIRTHTTCCPKTGRFKDAAIMLETKGNNKLTRDELASRIGKRIIMKDIHNLNARLNLDPRAATMTSEPCWNSSRRKRKTLQT